MPTISLDSWERSSSMCLLFASLVRKPRSVLLLQWTALLGLACFAQPSRPSAAPRLNEGGNARWTETALTAFTTARGRGKASVWVYTEELFLPPLSPGASPLSVLLFGRGLRFRETNLDESVWGWL